MQNRPVVEVEDADVVLPRGAGAATGLSRSAMARPRGGAVTATWLTLGPRSFEDLAVEP